MIGMRLVIGTESGFAHVSVVDCVFVMSEVPEGCETVLECV